MPRQGVNSRFSVRNRGESDKIRSCTDRHWMPDSHRMSAVVMDNQAGFQQFALVYNLGNFLRQLLLPASVIHWTMIARWEKRIKVGAKTVCHSGVCVLPDGRGGGSAEPVRPHPGTYPCVPCRAWPLHEDSTNPLETADWRIAGAPLPCGTGRWVIIVGG